MCYNLIILLSFVSIISAGTITVTTSQQYSTINCTANEPCNILCSVGSACQGTTIYCAADQTCDITCSGQDACEDAIIYAQHSSFFRLLDCATGSWTCIGITIYFPPNDYGTPRAKLIGADRGLSAGFNKNSPLQFYAIYGWNDLNVTTDEDSFSFANHAGTMYCTPGYTSSCSFSPSAWSCNNSDDVCNNPPTPAPSINPTIEFSLYYIH